MFEKNRLVVIVLTGTLLLAATVSAAGKKKAGLAVKAEQEVAGQGYGTAGCGLGSVLFGQKEGMVQVFAATTNDTFGSQTFGITSGTSNCNPAGGDRSAKVDVYIEVNKLALANDVARGNGETLAGLSSMLGCSDAENLGSALQKNYLRVFPSQDVNSAAVSRSIREVIQTNKSLSSTCQG